MKNIIEINPFDLIKMANSGDNAVELRSYAIGLIIQVNTAHEFMQIQDDFISHHLPDNTTMTMPYIEGMRLPDPLHLDEYVVIKHPAHLVRWKVDFYNRFGSCYMWQPKIPLFTEDNWWIVDPDEFDGGRNEKYWLAYGKYMEEKNRTITNFNKQQ